jgi:hypothetical protein
MFFFNLDIHVYLLWILPFSYVWNEDSLKIPYKTYKNKNHIVQKFIVVMGTTF